MGHEAAALERRRDKRLVSNRNRIANEQHLGQRSHHRTSRRDDQESQTEATL
jgi:hypothetical protein